jgi:hypothetical protein
MGHARHQHGLNQRSFLIHTFEKGLVTTVPDRQNIPMVSGVIKSIAGLAGFFVLYLAFFTYEDEEGTIQDKLKISGYRLGTGKSNPENESRRFFKR